MFLRVTLAMLNHNYTRMVFKSFTCLSRLTKELFFWTFSGMNSPKKGSWIWPYAGVLAWSTVCFAEVNKVEQIAPDVYFHEGDLKGSGHCNNGWIMFEDYVLVIDGNFPSGAQEIIPK